MGINTNLDFKIGLLVEEKGLKLEDFEAKIKKFSNSIKVANSSIKSMTKSIEELNIVGTKIDFSKSLDNFSKQNDKILDKIKKSKAEFEKINAIKTESGPKQETVIVKEEAIKSGYAKYLDSLKLNINSANNSLKNFSLSAGSAFKGLVLSSGPATKNIYEMSKAMLALNTSTGKFLLSMATFYTVSAAIQGVSEAYKYIFKTAMEFERLGTILNGLEGSAKKGEESFKWVKKFAQDTPFELQEVMDAFVRLKSHGLDTKYMKVYGDTAAGMGKTMVQTAEAVADAVLGQNERLLEFGLKGQSIGDKMLYTWSTASGKAKYVIVENNRQILESTLAAIFNEKYAGQTDALARTLEGSLNKAKDSFANFANELMTNSSVFEASKKLLQDISKYVDSFSNDKDKMKEFGVAFTDISISIIEGSYAIINVFGRLTNGIILLREAFKEGYRQIDNSVSNSSNFITAMGDLGSNLAESFGKRAVNYFNKDFDMLKEQKRFMEEANRINFKYVIERNDIADQFNKGEGEWEKGLEKIVNLDKQLNKGEKTKDQIIQSLRESKEIILKGGSEINITFSDFITQLKSNQEKAAETLGSSLISDQVNQTLIKPLDELKAGLNASAAELSSAYNLFKEIQSGIGNNLSKQSPIFTNKTIGQELKPGETPKTITDDLKAKEKAAKKAQKEAERIKDSGLIDYYEVLGNKSKAAYEKMLKYVEGLKKDTYLTKSQIAEMTVKLEDNLKVEEKISKSQSLSEYYEIIGETGKAAYENITQKMLELKLSGDFTEKQLIDINKALMKTRELDVEISSRDNLITYFRGVGNEAKALRLELDNEMASLSKSGQFDPQQLSDIKLNKEKELNKQITDMNASKREEELNKDMAYLIKKGDFKLAKEVELEERRKELLNKDLSPNQMLEEEARLISELDTKYQNLRITETDRMAKLKEGYSAYMEELSVRMNDYASLSKDVMTSFEGSLTNTFTSFFDTTSKSFLSLEQLGKSAMQGLLEAIKQAITKMIVLQAMNAAMGGVGGFGGGGFGGMFEKGGVFNGGNVQAFATGTVIDTPTYFPMSGNKTGLMGEAGPEAIMPLTRDSSGSLGVKLNGGTPSSGTGNIVINNYSNSNVRASQDSNGNTTITIEMLEEIDNRLASKVNSGNSSLDSILSKKYNMNKR